MMGDTGMKANLTDRYIRTRKPPATGRLVVTDTEAKGLALRVTTNGEKSWLIRYRPKGQAQKYETPGPYPAVSLAKARERARAILASAKSGVDLAGQERAAQEETRKASARPATVAALLDRYVAEYCKAPGGQRRWKITARLFEMHVAPALGSKSLLELRRA